MSMSEEQLERKRARDRERYRERMADPEYREQRNARKRVRFRERYRNEPEYRDRQLSKLRGRVADPERVKRRYALKRQRDRQRDRELAWYRERHGDEYRTTFLHPVSGSARYCAPCAWSALTGLSSDTWADKPMTDGDEHAALDRIRFEHGAPWYVDDLPDHLVDVGLDDFREPGRWALTVKWDHDDEPHAIAVAVHGADRMLADNHVRYPQPLAAVLDQHEPYRSAIVAGGFRLVPDDPLPGFRRAEDES